VPSIDSKFLIFLSYLVTLLDLVGEDPVRNSLLIYSFFCESFVDDMILLIVEVLKFYVG